MSLFSTIHLSKNALLASQLGIQVAANNIANADSPGYVRSKLVLTPAPPTPLNPDIVVGNGVKVEGVVRQLDAFLQKRLWNATGDLANGEVLESTYVSLEALIGELSKNDLSTSLSNFFNSIHDVLNQPEDRAVRNLAVLQGDTLTSEVRRLDRRVRELHQETNDRIVSSVDEINDLITEIGKLNHQVMEMELGGISTSDAVGLRDRREEAIKELSRLIGVQVAEQESGAVNVFVAGDYLVFDGQTQHVTAVTEIEGGMPTAELRLTRSDGLLRVSSGEVAGLLAARDEVLDGFLGELNTFTQTLMFEFNKIHAAGQGLVGHTSILGELGVDDRTVALDAAGLDFTPVHGSFQVEVIDTQSGATATHDLFVQLSGLDDDTTLQDLADALDAIDGISAGINVSGQLQIQGESSSNEFAFSNDTSGVLAALGINTFFSGTTASEMAVHQRLTDDSDTFAISQGGIGNDSRNGELLAELLTTPLETHNGTSLAMFYEQWMGEVSSSSSLAASVAEGLRTFHGTLEGQHLGISGVNMDEEAINLMAHQRAYQASARVISTINQLMDVLVNL